MAKIEYITLCI